MIEQEQEVLVSDYQSLAVSSPPEILVSKTEGHILPAAATCSIGHSAARARLLEVVSPADRTQKRSLNLARLAGGSPKHRREQAHLQLCVSTGHTFSNEGQQWTRSCTNAKVLVFAPNS